MKRHCLLLLAVALAALFQAGCTGATKSSSNSNSGAVNSGNTNPTSPPVVVTVSVSPGTATLRAEATQSFDATVTGSSNTAVTWQVNGVPGGNSASGTINSSGLYTAPAVAPVPNTATINAVSAADATAAGTAAIALLNPSPVLTGIAPTSVTAGSFTITLTGSGFIASSQVLLAGSSLATTFLSANQLRATGASAVPGAYAVAISNPDPGASVSTSQNLLVISAGTGTPPPACSAMSTGSGASLNGFVPFPAGNAWNQDISGASVDPNSAAIVNFIGGSVSVHPDFGSGLYQGESMGIPYSVVGASQPNVNINFSAYGDESDPGPMPIPVTAPIEGYPAPGSGDRHVLVLDNSNCWLYELYSSYPGATDWSAASAAVWDLTAGEQRPYTWTSTDAAGLPIFPGLARYDEVAAGQIQHALRFTLQSSRAAFVPPASHWAANSTNAMAAPMGMRMRLKASFNVSSFSPANQVILNALKTYGMIMADNGSSMYITGAPDDRWNNDDLHNLANVTASDFEVVQMSPIYTAANVPQGAAPVITTFAAGSQSVSAGTPVTLNWSVSGASYLIVSPDLGAVRGSSATVSPSQSTVYTLYATNAFGRTTAAVNITVH